MHLKIVHKQLCAFTLVGLFATPMFACDTSRAMLSVHGAQLAEKSVPLFQGKPIDLTREFYRKMATAHEKYSTLGSCLSKDDIGKVDLASAFQWEKYHSEQEVIACTTAIAQWAKTPNCLEQLFSANMANSRMFRTGNTEHSDLIVSASFDRQRYPRKERIFIGTILESWLSSYSVTNSTAGISVRFKSDLTLQDVKPIYTGK